MIATPAELKRNEEILIQYAELRKIKKRGPLQQIAKEYGLTRSRIHAIVQRGLKRGMKGIPPH